VDAYVTRDGKPVTDLTADEIELLEDGRPQTIQTFELVTVRPGGPDARRIEPATVAASRQAASDPRARVFVIFLDTKHTHITSAQLMRRPLAAFLDRVVGQDDLVALMTPVMAAFEITFTRRVGSMAAMLDQPWSWGQHSSIDATDPVEENYERCYPTTLTQPFEDQILGQMVLRRRVKLTLDALRDLVVHLDGLREERKAVLVVSEGWTLFREDRSLFPSKPMSGGVFVGPDGRLRLGDPSVDYSGMSMRECERDRMLLAGFSIGGSLTSYVACAAPEAFAAYAPVAGSFWRPHPQSCAGPVRLFHTHGTADRTVPMTGREIRPGFAQGNVFEAMQIWRVTDGCKAAEPDAQGRQGIYEIAHWTRCKPGTRLDFAVHDGGHVIPRGWAEMALDWFEQRGWATSATAASPEPPKPPL
jgi:hypothetical protein